MVLGRVAERAAIDDLLRAARSGRSGALVIRGEPGIGKSTLLRYAAEQAKDMAVLSARGYESESEIPFAGLADLLRPVLPLLDALPEPQAAALQSAMSLGPPVAGDRFSVCAATVGVLAEAAGPSSLLVIVDDVQWLDISSREAILFAARRLHADGIGLLMASRSTGDRSLTERENDYAGLRELRLEGLSPADADALCQELLPDASAQLRQQIFEDTAGNPLGIQELCDQGARAPIGTAGMPAQSRLARALWGRLAELPERTRRALLLVAAAGGAETDVVLLAARQAGLDLADFAPAEVAGLLVIEAQQITFRHPLLRSVLYGSSSMHERFAAHGALAVVLESVPGDAAADARAWHLAEARLPPDEEVSGLLAAAGSRARRRGGNLEAARAFEQAARFGTVVTRAALMVRAARCWQLAGRTGKVLPLLQEALPLTGDPGMRALIRHMAGYVQIWRALPRDGLKEMVEGAQEVEEVDPGRAAMMYADAALAYFMLGLPLELLRTTQRAFEVSEHGDDAARLVATVAYAGALVINGRRDEGRALLDAARPALLEVDPLARAQELAHAAYIWMWLEDYAITDQLLERMISRARSTGALGVLPQTLAMASELSFRMGRWPHARACAEESVALAEETRQANLYGLYFVARIDALQGRSGDALHMLNRTMTMAHKLEANCMDLFSGHTFGLLALGEGDLDEAIRRLEAVRDLLLAQQTRDQSVVPWAFDLVEAYARAGRTAEAQALLAEFAVDAEDRGADWLLALTWRCRGLLASREEMPAAFESALAAHDRCEMPFERARTLLCLGERLRRGRQKATARQHLRRALEIFEQLDAVSWAARARAELTATGEATTRGTGVVALLTPQELQVGLVVGRGASNQEAAAALFLSQKTIEYHLSNIYRKTNLRSRSELSVLTAAAS